METKSVILSGVAVFLIGEIIVRFFLAPLHRLKEVKGEIASTLLFHANKYGSNYSNLEEIADNIMGRQQTALLSIEEGKNRNSKLSKASDETRSMAAKLVSAAESIPFYNFLSLVYIVPPKDSVLKAKDHLIALSNSFGPNQNICLSSKRHDVNQLLRIKFTNASDN